MRGFIAVPVPEALRRELAAECIRFAPTLPTSRWAAATNLHLTLRFLGEVEASEVTRLAISLRGIMAARQPFDLILGVRGVFPPRGRPRVLWVGFEPSRVLDELQEAIATAADELLGLETERRLFHPHLTLGRCRRGWGAADAERWRLMPCGSSGTVFTVTYVDLMESRLTPRGANHRRVERLTLGS